MKLTAQKSSLQATNFPDTSCIEPGLVQGWRIIYKPNETKQYRKSLYPILLNITVPQKAKKDSSSRLKLPSLPSSILLMFSDTLPTAMPGLKIQFRGNTILQYQCNQVFSGKHLRTCISLLSCRWIDKTSGTV